MSESAGPELARVSFKQRERRQSSIRWSGYILFLGSVALIIFALQTYDVRQLFQPNKDAPEINSMFGGVTGQVAVPLAFPENKLENSVEETPAATTSTVDSNPLVVSPPNKPAAN